MARMRLHGLIGTYPNDLGLWHILGQLYLEIGKPWKAGRFLYLIKDKSKEKQEAVREFLIQYEEPHRRLRKLRVKGHIDDFEPGYAKAKLQDLLYQCDIKDGKFPEYGEPELSIWMDAFCIGIFFLSLATFGYIIFLLLDWIVGAIADLF